MKQETVKMTTSKELATQEPTPQPLGAITIGEYRTNRQLLLQVMQQEMKPGVDYGISPGTDKPALWKPGAEKLVSMFCFAPSFTYTCELHEDRHRTYTVKCTLKHRGTETFLGDADAVCSTMESRYTNRKDPLAVVNPADYFNTAMKIGGKRSLIAAVLFVTGASDIFTQDMDDDEGNGKGANGSATSPAGAFTRGGRGTDTPGDQKAAAGLWTGTLGSVTAKTFKKDGRDEEYFILGLMDGRSASTFDTKIAALAREAKGQIVKMGTKTGKKASFFNVDSFEVLGHKPDSKPKESDPLEHEPDDIPF